MTAAGTVLCYLPVPTAWEKKLRPALAVAGARAKRVLPQETGETVGALAGLKGFERTGAAAETPPAEPVLVFSGLNGGRLDAALQALRRAGVPRSVYKAVVTGDNAPWTFAALAEELQKEREAIRAGEASPHTAARENE